MSEYRIDQFITLRQFYAANVAGWIRDGQSKNSAVAAEAFAVADALIAYEEEERAETESSE